MVCVFGLGLSRPQNAQSIGGFNRAGGFRSAPSRPGPALISRPLTSLPLNTAGPAFRSRGISRAFTGPGGVVSSSGGLVSGQSPLPFTSVTGPTGRGIIRPGGLVSNSGGLISGANRVVSGPGLVSVSGPGVVSVSGPGGLVSGVNRVVSGPGLASQSGRFVSSGPTRVSSGPARVSSVPGLGVAGGPLVSPTPTRVVSAGPVSAVGPAIQASPVSVAGKQEMCILRFAKCPEQSERYITQWIVNSLVPEFYLSVSRARVSPRRPQRWSRPACCPSRIPWRPPRACPS